MANQMRLTLQLSAIDNMSRVVSAAAQNSLRSMTQMQQTAQVRARNARNTMFESGAMAMGGVAALSYPLKMAANYEMLRIRMIALTQSQSEGMALYKQTIKLASETPLTLEDVAQGTTRLIGFGRSAKDAIVDIKMLGDVVSLAGGDIQAAMIAYGQAAGEGRVMTRDLTQFVNAGVPIFKMLGEVTGANGAELKKMAENGQLSFDILYQAFQKATREGGQFANGMRKMSESASGGWVRMKDEIGRFADVFGSSVLPMLKSWNETMIPVIANTAEWFRNHETLTSIIMGSAGLFTVIAGGTFLYSAAVWMLNSGLLAATGSLGSFILLHSGLGVVLSWVSFQVGILTGGIAFLAGESAFLTSVMNIGLIPTIGIRLAAAMMRLNAVMIANPIGAIVTIIAALVIYIGYAVVKWKEFGATMMLLMGPVGWVVNAFMSIREHWGAITDAFKNNGMLAGIKQIGIAILDSIAYPLQQLMGIIANLTGFDWAKNAQKSILAFRTENLLTTTQISKTISESKDNRASSPVGPTAAAQLVGQGGVGGSTTVTYSPTITIGAGVSKEDKESFTAMLERHKTEVARMVNEANRQQGRKQFA